MAGYRLMVGAVSLFLYVTCKFKLVPLTSLKVGIWKSGLTLLSS